MATSRRLHDGYTLVSDTDDASSVPAYQHLKQQQRLAPRPVRPASSRLRDVVVLTALVVALCVGFASVIWEPHQLEINRHVPARHRGSAATNDGNNSGGAGEKAMRSSARGESTGNRVVFNEVQESVATIELSTSPTLVEDGGDLVVLWKPAASGEFVQRQQDFITLSCGPTNGNGDFLQKKSVTETDAMPNSVRFSGAEATHLHMMRCNYTVKYFTFDSKAGTLSLLAQIEVGMTDPFNAPKHGHLALTENDDEMAVMFNSASSRIPQVRFGLRAAELSMHAQGTSTTYKATDMCHAPATTVSQLCFRDPGYMHKVIITSLKPDQLYFYQYGNDQDGWSRIHSFRSKPDSKTARTAKFIAYGDMGVDGAPAAQSTAARVFGDVVGNDYDSFLLHFGDVSYARGKAHVWDKFFHLIEPYATRIPYMVSIGNHEYDYTSGGEHDPSGGAGSSGNGFHPTWGNFGSDSGGECSVPMKHRWHGETLGSFAEFLSPATGNSIYWYSFNYAGIHVVQMSTEHNWTRGSEQYEWLKRDLQSVDRNVTPWVILAGHRMMYTTQIIDSECSVSLVAGHLRAELEELLYENRVNMMLVGHQHAYERSCPVYKGECVDDGKATVHVLAGSAGFEIDSTEFSKSCGNWSLSHVNEYGYLRVSTSPAAMTIQFVLNKNGVVYDESAIMVTMDSTKADVVLAPLVGRPTSSPSSLVPPAASDPFSVSAANANGKLRVPPLGKLTPLEKKERDRLRKKEQAKRRLERLHERDNAAQVLQQTKLSSSAWHQKEREEEKLVLRRLERDMVFPQKTHPATAGYEFFSGSKISCYYSPVFHSYSHALCPASQLPKSHLQQRQIDTVTGSVQQEATFVHPACHGYAMAKENDCTKVSPVFFFAGFAKIPLERVVLENDDDDKDDSESDQEGSGGDEVAVRKGVTQVLNPIERQKLQALMDARVAPIATGRGKFPSSASPSSCAVCKSSNGSTMGCPGCFTFSHERHREVVSSQAAQRLKTPKTQYQEQEERLERHKALQRQLVMPSIYRQKQQQEEQFAANGTTARKEGEEEDYYMHVLVDHQAIHKHRTIPSQSAMYESLTLPYMADRRCAVEANWSSVIASQILSLRVDIKSSIVYVYELYRANVELPNRPIHLLLPTSKGLFYFNERIEDATDVRNGLVFGEFYLEDFNLVQQQQQQQSYDLKGNATSNSNGATMTTRGEFMLFSVAVLNENSTPQLLAHYLQQNFHILPHEIANIDRMPIHHAICALPKQSLDRDLCQLKLFPHVQHMQAFGFTSKQLALAEQQRERETLLRVAYLEKKQAKLEAKKKQNQLNQQNGKPSAKVRRAMAYFQYICESTSLVATFGSPARNLKVWEERLEKLWQCFQFFEEWKICKGGRLIEAETTDDTLALFKLHQQATVDAFDQVLERTSGQGPLLYPILCIGGGGGISTRKLVVKLGVRLGPTAQENREYGLLLNLEQDFDALEVASASVFKDDDRHKMKKRGFTKKSLVLLAQEEEQKISTALALCADFEWKLKDPQKTSSNSNATLFTNTDLLRPPFYQFKWTCVAKAYKQAMRVIAVQVAKLEEYNTLARVLQNADTIPSKAQIEKWQSEANRFLEMLSPSTEDTEGPGSSSVAAGSNSSSKTSFLAQAARRVLVKKGAALLKKRALQHKKQIREREDELLRLQKLQEENELPRLSLVQQMKLAFVKDKAPQIRAMLELTPAEKLKLKASQLLDKVAASANSAATAMKKEYKVRAL